MSGQRVAGPSPRPPDLAAGFWGKYRGTVLDNLDPFGQGRLLCDVPAVPGMLLNWALPCIPYAGLEEGFYAMPNLGANVWVEFEGGDASHPIWTGCFWELLEVPVALELSPEDPALVKVFRSTFCTLVLSDVPEVGGITLNVIDPAVDIPVTLAMNSIGVEVNVGGVNLVMNPEEGVTITVDETVVTITPEGVGVATPTVTVLADDTNITGNVAIVGDVSIVGALTVAGQTTLDPSTTVSGVLTVNGAAQIEPVLNVTGEMSVEGDANVAGAMTVELELNALGEVSVEGDMNILGGQQIEGNSAVLGLIEGIVVPPAFL